NNYAAAGANLVPRECAESQRITELLDNITAETNKASAVLVQVRKALKGGGPDFQPLDLNQVLQWLQPFLKDNDPMSQVPIRLELAEALPQVVGDRFQLQEVLHNLIHNGQEANLEGSAGPATPVVVRTAREGKEVVVSITDAGPGLPPEMDVDVVVQPFFSTRKEGFGLGLWIAYTLIEGHGGKLEAHNNAPGPGATFRIRLPLAEPGHQPGPVA
ncbi:MAG TPA: ATP-binding protein, partial [Gammaproteobacteria bacterium]|nr:ATP-binding protein [Gammaproteobacteria bacterium]